MRSKPIQRLLTPFLPFLGSLLLAFIFFVKVNILLEKVDLLGLMGFLFHIPFLLFLIAAILMEIIDSMERRKSGLLGKKEVEKGTGRRADATRVVSFEELLMSMSQVVH